LTTEERNDSEAKNNTRNLYDYCMSLILISWGNFESGYNIDENMQTLSLKLSIFPAFVETPETRVILLSFNQKLVVLIMSGAGMLLKFINLIRNMLNLTTAMKQK